MKLGLHNLATMRRSRPTSCSTRFNYMDTQTSGRSPTPQMGLFAETNASPGSAAQ